MYKKLILKKKMILILIHSWKLIPNNKDQTKIESILINTKFKNLMIYLTQLNHKIRNRSSKNNQLPLDLIEKH
jgi:hypothetical protein